MAKELQTDLIGQRVHVLFWKGSDRPGDGTIRAVTYDAKEATFMYAIALDSGDVATLDSRWFKLINDTRWMDD
jgi:hypothetical protein